MSLSRVYISSGKMRYYSGFCNWDKKKPRIRNAIGYIQYQETQDSTAPGDADWYLKQDTASQFSILSDLYLLSQNAYHEYWLNESLPWIWMTPVDYVYGVFKSGFLWTGRGLIGPIRSKMYVQKLPTPNDLWEVSKGDFNKIDGCVVKTMFEEINGT